MSPKIFSVVNFRINEVSEFKGKSYDKKYAL